MDKKQTCILVLGMHRSGTSALTGTLGLLDVYLGSELIKDKFDNPKGHFENNYIHDINEELLSKIDSSWHDIFYDYEKAYSIKETENLKQVIKKEFEYSSLFAIKDPRLVYLFPVYERALKDMDIDIKIVIPYRNPLEVANSLNIRNGFSIEKGMLLWLYHFLLAEKFSRAYNRVFIDYDELIEKPKKIFNEISEKLNIDFMLKFEIKEKDIKEFLTPSLKHHNISINNLSENTPNVLTQILELKDSLNKKDIKDKFNQLSKELFDFKKVFFNQEVINTYKELDKTRVALDEKENILVSLYEKIKQKDTDIKKLQDIQTELQSGIKQKDTDIKKLQDIQTELQTELQSSIKQKDTDIKKLQDIQTELQNSIKQKDTDIKKLQDIQTELQSGIKQKDTDIKKLQDIQTELQNSIKQKDTDILQVSQEKVKLEKQLKTEIAKVNNFKSVVSKKDTRIDSLSSKVNNINNKNDQLLIQLHKKEVQIKHLNELAQSLRIKNRLKRGIKKVLPSLIVKFISEVRNNGLSEAIEKMKYKLFNSKHYSYNVVKNNKEIKDKIKNFSYKPKISIIMPVYNVSPKWLNLAIESIKRQFYGNWDLCIVDDASTNKHTLNYLKNIKHSKIRIKFLKKNCNISCASNEALKLSNGDYILLMDNDDELTPDALFEVVKTINETQAEFIYSDEDKIELDGRYTTPHYKPDFAPDHFLSQNYISHIGVIKKDIIDKAGGFTVGLEGAQDYDLYLKVFEITDKIVHIPKVLYHWRKIPGSTAENFGDKSYAWEAGRIALESMIKRRGLSANALKGKHPGTYRVKYEIIDEPKVSIVIPFKDMPELLKMCVESILEKSTYKNFELIGISNNSEQKATFEEMKRLENLDERVKFYEYNVPFNYSKINNFAVEKYAQGKHIILLNNDIEILTSDWIESMLEFSQRDNVGAVGAKLYYPNNKIQHAGVIIGIGGVAGHSHKYFDKKEAGYFARLDIVQNLSAVTAACLMVKKSIYEEVKGLNEKDLKIAFNDVDFCLRIREKGYLNIYTPYCEAYHHESISRGHEDTQAKKDRFRNEVLYMQERHKGILEDGDPYYNHNLTLKRENFSLKGSE